MVPRLYGLPKIHKCNIPLRPIVSFVSSPTYNLSKHLVTLLSPLVGHSTSAVKNSGDLVQFVSSVELTSSEILLSFDVVALFTKIPVDLAIDVVRRRLEDDTVSERTNLTIDSIITLLEFCLKATYLRYQGCYYQQIFGTAMGSPVSVTIANLVMEDIERALTTFERPPRFWKRYVDDALTAMHPDTVQSFHDHLNSINPNIQFTLEVESDGTLPYLDVLLHHNEDGSIVTSVYRKPTHTDKYLDFSSHHPLQHKISVIHTLFNRACTMSSSLVCLKTEELVVNQALRLNGYPRRLIRKHSRPRQHIPDQPDQSTERNPTAFISLPYIQGVSESIRQVLSKLDIKVSLYPYSNLQQMLVRSNPI